MLGTLHARVSMIPTKSSPTWGSGTARLWRHGSTARRRRFIGAMSSLIGSRTVG